MAAGGGRCDVFLSLGALAFWGAGRQKPRQTRGGTL